MEAQGKDCRFVTRSRENLLRIKLASVRESLVSWGFIQCHRSYLVNWRAIYQIGKKDIELTNGERLPISRGNVGQVQSEFLAILQREV